MSDEKTVYQKEDERWSIPAYDPSKGDEIRRGFEAEEEE